MSLKEYYDKRDFEKTPEPKGKIGKKAENRFVIQRHEARRLHYDLRLEMSGVLKSWAVPKGPSMNPEDKRLAIHTEDHPLEYLYFSGIIPKGNYGAGKMEIWDQGRYRSAENTDNEDSLEAAYEKGKLVIEIEGSKLAGRFALVRSHFHTENKDHWLLIKVKDQYAIEKDYDAENFAPQPLDLSENQQISDSFELKKMISPMLAAVSKEPFDDPDWIYEFKYDGYRILSNIEHGQVEMYSRNGISYSERYSKVRQELSSLDHTAILDGEMVVMDKAGLPQFEAIQNYENQPEGNLHYFVFDLLHLNGYDLFHLPLIDRKELLKDLIEDMKLIHYSQHVVEKGISFFEEAVDQGWEGVMAKKSDSQYYPGKRSEDWRKIKSKQITEAVICGYTYSEKAGRPFGSLILGVKEDGKWKYTGNCGTGFSVSQMEDLFEQFQAITRKTSPFSEKINLKGRHPQWLKPTYVCEVMYSERTRQGMLRHPVFYRLRSDKNADEVNPEVEEVKRVSPEVTDSDLEIGGHIVSVSNPEKILWPDSGIRKYDLLDYYLHIAEWILPYLIDRPQSLHRHPDGITKPGFYQKNQENLPEWVESIEIKSSSGKMINYLLCQNEATLMYLANLGCIEINPWLVRIENLDSPDYTVIDLDPSPANTFDEVREAALAVKTVLDRAGINGYAKTSGSRGIHIFIPMGGAYDFSAARDFTRLLCYFVRDLLPDLVTLERSIDKRQGKIYLDYLQNRTGQTIVAPYSVRPVAGALVSSPVTWEELRDGVVLEDFHLFNIQKRLAEKGDLFSGLLKEELNMEKAIRRLENPGEEDPQLSDKESNST